MPPPSLRKMCDVSERMIDSPLLVWARIDARLPMVPLNTRIAASVPSMSAAFSSKAWTVVSAR